jgi:hypothetical protein
VLWDKRVSNKNEANAQEKYPKAINKGLSQYILSVEAGGNGIQ